ncbi:hypothetical protein JCM10212_003422 [Sporobolomyces blumeae]
MFSRLFVSRFDEPIAALQRRRTALRQDQVMSPTKDGTGWHAYSEWQSGMDAIVFLAKTLKPEWDKASRDRQRELVAGLNKIVWTREQWDQSFWILRMSGALWSTIHFAISDWDGFTEIVIAMRTAYEAPTPSFLERVLGDEGLEHAWTSANGDPKTSLDKRLDALQFKLVQALVHQAETSHRSIAPSWYSTRLPFAVDSAVRSIKSLARENEVRSDAQIVSREAPESRPHAVLVLNPLFSVRPVVLEPSSRHKSSAIPMYNRVFSMSLDRAIATLDGRRRALKEDHFAHVEYTSANYHEWIDWQSGMDAIVFLAKAAMPDWGKETSSRRTVLAKALSSFTCTDENRDDFTLKTREQFLEILQSISLEFHAPKDSFFERVENDGDLQRLHFKLIQAIVFEAETVSADGQRFTNGIPRNVQRAMQAIKDTSSRGKRDTAKASIHRMQARAPRKEHIPALQRKFEVDFTLRRST